MATTPPGSPDSASGLSNRGLNNRGLSNKIFGLGLARTGTTSLHHAMEILGFRSAPDSVPLLDSIDVDFLRAHDAFFDNPIPFRYEALDSVCPDSRWIVTQRPVQDWLRSMRWLFGPGLDRLDPATRVTGDRVHREVYGSAEFDEDRLRALYHDHYNKLAGWVPDRQAVWIHVDEGGLAWEPICELLSLPVPTVDFPHSNPRGWRRPSLRRTTQPK